MRLGKFALNNHISINTLRVALALLGLYMLFTMQREQYPNVPLYYVHILVAYPGATAFEVEKDITQKVEEQLLGISGVNTMNSLISDGLNFTRLEFSQSLSAQDFQNKYQEVQALIGNLELPKNALRPNVVDFTYLDFLSIVNVVVSSKSASDERVEGIIRDSKIVRDTIKTIDGVMRVESKGLFDKRIVINLDKDQLRSRGIAVQEVNKAISQWNVSVPGGVLRTQTQELNIRVSGNFSTAENISEIIIRKDGNNLTKLKDIAHVTSNYNTQLQRVRFNGETAVEFKVYKKESADSVTLVKKIKKNIGKLQNKFDERGQDISINVFADTTESINNTINVLVANALTGFVLLFVSLFIFLGWRSAVISAIEIPFTFATSFFVLKLLGITLNSSTLFALVLVLGMIVDHSIVILENIIRLRHFHKKKRKQAVIEGLDDVAFPIITSSLTTIGTFFPLIFMPGFIGKFLIPVPITITVTLIVSTVSALVVIPVHYMTLPGDDRTHEMKIFEVSRCFVGYVLSFVLKFRKIVCIITVIVISGGIAVFFFVPVSLYDTEDQPFFFVDITMPAGSSMQRSNAIVKGMERKILPLQREGKVKNILTFIGNTEPDYTEGIRIDKANNAQFQIEVESVYSNKKAIPMDIVMEEVRSRIVSIAGPDSVRIRKQRSGPPSTPAIGYQIRGDSLNAMSRIEKKIRAKLSTFDELYNIRSNFVSKTPLLIIDIDKEKAAQYGLTLAYIGDTLRRFFAEDPIGSVFVNNEQTDIVVKLGTKSGLSKKEIIFITFPTSDGTIVPFSSFATVKEEKNLASIYRENGKRMVRITAESFSRSRVRQINTSIAALAEQEITNEKEKIEFKIGGEFDQFSGLLESILVLLLVSIVLVYVILTAEFKSYFQPILIMLTIFFTTIGVSIYLLLSGTALSISVLYSFVALVGVVVNNAIVLISTANDNFKKTSNMTHVKAIMLASKQRFKPVVLTSFTTIVGVLPTALGLSGSSPIWQPMASTIAVGLSFSTITTLFILPAFYALFSKDDYHADVLLYNSDETMNQNPILIMRRGILPGKMLPQNALYKKEAL